MVCVARRRGARCARSATGAPGGGRLARRTRDRRPGPGVSGHRPAGARPAAGRAAAAPGGPVPQDALDAVWAEPVQRARALDGLVAGRAGSTRCRDDRYALPG